MLRKNLVLYVCSSDTYNPGQSIWNKIEKSSKTGHDKKSLISTLAYFLTVTDKA